MATATTTGLPEEQYKPSLGRELEVKDGMPLYTRGAQGKWQLVVAAALTLRVGLSERSSL
jgi:hypothetical protein